MKRAANIVCVLAALTFAECGHAKNQHSIDIRSGPLGDAIVQLGQQTGSSIGMSDQSLTRIAVVRLRGRMSVEKAIQRLLHGKPARAVPINGQSWRIIGAALSSKIRPAPTKPTRQRSYEPPARPAPDYAEPADIIVTASKRATALKYIPVTVSVLDGSTFTAGLDSGGTAAILEKLPSVTSTHAGTGRNKLFIRGVADSGFTGPTQATVGQYLGEMRLNYNAPDPDLRLYDINSVEVMEGPQGTLYGAGSLGGIIRANPNLPNLTESEAFASYALASTARGDESVDAHALINIPIVRDRAALRVLGYGAREGGYVDDSGRGLKDVNSIRVVGGRAAFSFAPLDDWRLDLTGVGQSVRGDDAQYAQRGSPGLSRSSPMPQTFGSDYGLANVRVTGAIGGLRLVSSLGFVKHDMVENYDATKLRELPTLFRQENRISLFSIENRVSRDLGNGHGWVIGGSYIQSVSQLKRSLLPATPFMPLPGVKNRLLEWAVFGEATIGISQNIHLTMGGRVSSAKLSGEAFDVPAFFDTASFQKQSERTETIFLPSVAVAARPFRNLTAFVRFQQGFRPGGLAVDGFNIRHFRNDRTSTIESGFRFGDLGQDRIAVIGTVAYTDWKNIQADLTDGLGFPTTANIGDGHILSLQGQISAKVTKGLTVDGAIIFSHSRLDSPSQATQVFLTASAQQTPALLLTVPNVARFGGRASLSYRHLVSDQSSLILSASTRYIGKSRLGIGPVLGAEQGGYLNSNIGLKWERERRAIFINISNIFNTVGNRYALGTPFALPDGDQYTPLRPRTIMAGFNFGF